MVSSWYENGTKNGHRPFSDHFLFKHDIKMQQKWSQAMFKSFLNHFWLKNGIKNIRKWFQTIFKPFLLHVWFKNGTNMVQQIVSDHP